MIKRICFIGAFVGVLAPLTWSQQPTPSPLPQPSVGGQIDQHKAEEPKQQSAPDKNAPNQIAPSSKSPNKQKTQKETGADSIQAPEETGDAKGWSLSDKIAVGAASAAFLQFVAVLWTIMEMRLSSQRELRAYVGIVGGSIIYRPFVEGGQCLHVHIDLKNFGNTPGYKMTTWIKEPKILDKDAVPFDNPTPIADRTGESMVAPSGAFFIDWFLPINTTDIPTLNDKSKQIYIWGGVDFMDAFGRNRYFIFRMVNSNGAIINFGDGFALRPHKIGYDAN